MSQVEPASLSPNLWILDEAGDNRAKSTPMVHAGFREKSVSDGSAAPPIGVLGGTAECPAIRWRTGCGQPPPPVGPCCPWASPLSVEVRDFETLSSV